MLLAPSREVKDEALKKGMRYVVWDGVTSQIMATLTGGTFLIAYALSIGASNVTIGFLWAIPAFAGLVQLFAVYLIERLRNRRLITVTSAAIARLAFLLIALTPFLFTLKTSLIVLVIAIGVNALFGNVSGCSWNSWMRDLIPSQRLGSFFSRRLAIATAFGMAASYGAAYFVDSWHARFPQDAVSGYAVLFAVGTAAGLLGAFFLARTPEPVMAPSRSEGRAKTFSLLQEPFKDQNFRNMMWFLGSWNFAVNLALPFFTVYMLSILRFPLTLIISLSLLTQLLNLLFFQLWGSFADRFSNKSVLSLSGSLFIFTILGWAFTTIPTSYAYLLTLVIVLHVAMGIAAAGVTVASSNISLKLAPQGRATAYLATNTLINSVAAGVAPIVGGRIADLFATRELLWVLTYHGPKYSFSLPTLHLEQWSFAFALSFLVGVYSLHRLTAIQEEGEATVNRVTAKEFLVDFKNHVRDSSSMQFGVMILGFPFGALQALRKKVLLRGGAHEQEK